MLALLKKRIKNQHGFTLVELMAVVVIIGILIAIAIPVYANIQEGVKERADEASARVLNAAAQAWAVAQTPIKDLKGSTVTLAILKGNDAGGPFIDEDFAEAPQSQKWIDNGEEWDNHWDKEAGAFKLKKGDTN